MALKLYSDSDIQNIANAIRGKNGSSDKYKVNQMASAITAIPTGITPSGSQVFTENGIYDVTNIAVAVVDIANEYYTGIVEVIDTYATSITIPVGVGSKDEFLIEFYLSKTGTVTDGVVTYDSNLNKNNLAITLMCSGFGCRYRYNSKTIFTTGLKPLFMTNLAYTYSGTNNGVQAATVNNANNMVLGEDSTIISSGNSTQFGATGYYYAYTYHMFVARGVL